VSRDLWRAFQALPVPDTARVSGQDNVFSVAPYPGRLADRVGRDWVGRPVVLLAVPPGEPARGVADLVLENLSVVYRADCVLRRNDATETHGCFAVVRCLSSDPALQKYFFVAMELIVSELGVSPSQAELSSAIDVLVNLFQAMHAPPRKTIQGLWAELLTIRVARDPVAMAKAWHPSVDSTFDFSEGSRRLEVKSTSSSQRIHHFSLDQLRPIPGVELVVLSVIVKGAGAGSTIAELVEEIRELLPRDLHRKVQLQVASTLGADWMRGREDSFDREWAVDSMRFYARTSVPCPDMNVPTGVTNVHFQADLGGATALAEAELGAVGGIFASAVPLTLA